MIREWLPDRSPARLVAVGDAGPRTAADLASDTARIARALRERGPGDVLLTFEDRYAFAAALLGVWRAGRAALLPPNTQTETLVALAHRDGVAAFLHDRPGAPEGTDLASLLGGAAIEDPVDPLPAPARIAVLATSGSTGTHQLVPKTAAQLLGEAAMQADLFAAGSRVLATVPSHHIYGLLFGVLAPIRARAAFVRETPIHAEVVAATIARHGVTHLVSVPAHLRGLEALAPGPRRLERVLSSGAPLPAETARAVERILGLPVTEAYGSSETGGIGWREGPEGAWRPFRGVKVSADEDGVLLVDSPLLPPGSPRPVRCADRVALEADGRFRLLGRADGIVKVGGKRIALAEVEQRSLALPGVRDAAALAQPAGGSRGEEIWLAVAAAPHVGADALREELRRWLDPTTLPRRIRIVDALPREANGKITQRRLRALFVQEEPVVDLDPEWTTAATDDRGAETRTFGVTVPPDLVWFRGHFPERPVLAGVVQLHSLVLRQVARQWPDLGAPRKIVRLKFKRIIGPGARLTLRLVREAGAGRVAFDIESGGAGCASGVFVFSGERTP